MPSVVHCIYLMSRSPRFDTWSGHILSFLPQLIQEGRLSVTGESMCTEYWFNHFRGLSLPRNSVVMLTDRSDMIIAVYCGRKATKQQTTHFFPFRIVFIHCTMHHFLLNIFLILTIVKGLPDQIVMMHRFGS